MRETDSIIEKKPESNLTRYGIYALILLMVFLLGFIPMWLQKRDVAQQLDATRNQLQKSEIKGLLTTAIVEARRGEYEPARQTTSEFYTRLDDQIKAGEQSAYSTDERGKLNSVFENRDALITLLAQRDQASTERLNDVYTNFQTALGVPPPPAAPPSPVASPIAPPSP